MLTRRLCRVSQQDLAVAWKNPGKQERFDFGWENLFGWHFCWELFNSRGHRSVWMLISCKKVTNKVFPYPEKHEKMLYLWCTKHKNRFYHPASKTHLETKRDKQVYVITSRKRNRLPKKGDGFGWLIPHLERTENGYTAYLEQRKSWN